MLLYVEHNITWVADLIKSITPFPRARFHYYSSRIDDHVNIPAIKRLHPAHLPATAAVAFCAKRHLLSVSDQLLH